MALTYMDTRPIKGRNVVRSWRVSRIRGIFVTRKGRRRFQTYHFFCHEQSLAFTTRSLKRLLSRDTNPTTSAARPLFRSPLLDACALWGTFSCRAKQNVSLVLVVRIVLYTRSLQFCTLRRVRAKRTAVEPWKSEYLPE